MHRSHRTHRSILFVVLCVGVIVRSSPAQDYYRSQYRLNDRVDRSIDNRGRYDNTEDLEANRMRRRLDAERHYRPDFSADSRVRSSPARTVKFFQEDNRFPTDRSEKRRYESERFPEERYRSNREYPVRQAAYTPTRNDIRRPPTPRTNCRPLPNSYHSRRIGYAPAWPPAGTAYPSPSQYSCPPCNHGPTTPRGTYVADGIVGQPVLYTNGQPIRNLFRSLGL